LLGYLSDVLIPFAVAMLLAYLINPLVSRVQRKIRNRLTAVLISLVIVCAAASLLCWLLIPRIVTEIERMGTILTDVVNNSEFARRANEYLPEDIWQALRDYAKQEDVQEFFQTDNFQQVAMGVLRKALPGVWSVISGATSMVLGLLGLAVILLYLVFLLLDYPKLKDAWHDMLPPDYRKPVLGFLSDFNDAMHRYFRGQAMIAGTVGILLATGFGIIGLPMGIVLGLFIGLLNMVPYLQIAGLIPAFLMSILQALETGQSIWITLGLAVMVFAVVQTIQDAVLTPRIMGNVTGLSPAVILLSLSVWGKLLGIFGLLIALPMTCILWTYYRRYVLDQRDANNSPQPAASETG
jgi:predicted PurR-regulated permease PerM